MQALPALSTLVASTHSGMRGERLFFAGAGGGNGTRCTQFTCGWEQLP